MKIAESDNASNKLTHRTEYCKFKIFMYCILLLLTISVSYMYNMYIVYYIFYRICSVYQF